MYMGTDNISTMLCIAGMSRSGDCGADAAKRVLQGAFSEQR